MFIDPALLYTWWCYESI